MPRNPDALAANWLVNGDDAVDYIGRELPKGDPVDADMAEYAQAYVDLVRAQVVAYEAAGWLSRARVCGNGLGKTQRHS